MSPWIYLRFLFLPVLAVLSYFLGTWWTFSIPVICFVIHPIGNLLSQKKSSSHDEHGHFVYNKQLYRLVPLLFVPVLVGLTVWAITKSHSYSSIEFLGMCLSVGIVNGVLGFTLAHEFVHRHNLPEKVAGHILLLQNNYSYYSIEHIGGHHLYACTKRDPHTAAIGESIYHFLARAILRTAINAWEIESRRLKRLGKKKLTLHNRMLMLILLELICYFLIVIYGGWNAFFFFISQSTVSILILNFTGYLQHYGLMRKETRDGRVEKISAHHAWSSKPGKDGLNLFELGKHADHHMHPSHTYNELVHHHDSPEQPTGYSGMMWLAAVPPLWFKIMNKRINLFINKTERHETT